MAYLARAIEIGRKSAGYLITLPPELRDEVHLPDLGDRALDVLRDVDPTVLTPHAIAVSVYNLVTKLQLDAQDSGHRHARNLMEDADRRVVSLMAELRERDRVLQAADERTQLLITEAESSAKAFAELRAKNADLTIRGTGLEAEGDALRLEVARHLATIDEMTRRDRTDLTSLKHDMRELKDLVVSAARESATEVRPA